VAPPDHHMLLEPDRIRLSQGRRSTTPVPPPTLCSRPPPKPTGSRSSASFSVTGAWTAPPDCGRSRSMAARLSLSIRRTPRCP
jgi:hypothetical protein